MGDKRYIDDVFSLWDTSREEINKFVEQANKHHPTIKFTAEISDKEITFLDTCVYKGERFDIDLNSTMYACAPPLAWSGAFQSELC